MDKLKKQLLNENRYYFVYEEYSILNQHFLNLSC